MVKKLKAAAGTDGAYDKLFQSVTAVAKEKFPGQVYSGNAEAMRVVCLPLPAFSVRFLFQQEGWPVGRFFQIVGEQESCKSSFGYEVLRWHGLVPGGGGILIPTEPKDAPELFRSIVGYDHPRMRYHDKCKTVQDWNGAVSWWVKTFKAMMDGTKQKPGPGRKAPIGIMVDSLAANLTEGEYGKVHKDGSSERHFAELAALLKDYVMYITQEIDDYPFTLIGINHLKLSQEKVGMFTKNVRNIVGGKTLKFFETTEIEMRRVTSTTPGKEIDRVVDDERGIELEIAIHKNSLAPHEKIRVEMLWYTDYEDRDPAGHFRQKTFFDWHTASIEILAQLLKGDGKRAKRLREVIDLTVDTDTRKVACSQLGIGPKSKVRLREAGVALEEKLVADPAFRNELYAETGIRRRYLFQPHLDYREQIEGAVRLASVAEAGAAATASPFIVGVEEPPP